LPWPKIRPTQKRPLLLLVATHRQKGERQVLPGPKIRPTPKRPLLLLVALATQLVAVQRQLLPGPNLRPTQKRPLLFCSTCYSTLAVQRQETHRQKGETHRQKGERQEGDGSLRFTHKDLNGKPKLTTNALYAMTLKNKEYIYHL
jgi:hypothetical protein